MNFGFINNREIFDEVQNEQVVKTDILLGNYL
jgi:hypothetical protein